MTVLYYYYYPEEWEVPWDSDCGGKATNKHVWSGASGVVGRRNCVSDDFR